MKFNVYGTATIGVTIKVEAETEQGAIEMAYEKFPGLTGYAGNGGFDKLVGVNDSDVSLDAGDEFDFSDAEPA